HLSGRRSSHAGATTARPPWTAIPFGSARSTSAKRARLESSCRSRVPMALAAEPGAAMATGTHELAGSLPEKTFGRFSRDGYLTLLEYRKHQRGTDPPPVETIRRMDSFLSRLG